MASDSFVDHDGLTLAVRDHGGHGASLLLLHGAGAALTAWSEAAPLLARDHRVVAMDLRGHGLSGDGAFGWRELIGDVEAVRAALGLGDVIVVGHSLGGMLAVCCADAQDRVLAAVNVDGHGAGAPADYPGLDPAVVAERLEQLRVMQESQLGAVLPAAVVEAAPPAARHALERSLRRRADGQWELRPEPEVAREMLAAIEALDLFALYGRRRRPLAVMCCTKPPPVAAGPPWLSELHAARLEGLESRLGALTGGEPPLVAEFLDAGHGVLTEQPAEVTRRIRGFVRALGESG